MGPRKTMDERGHRRPRERMSWLSGMGVLLLPAVARAQGAENALGALFSFALVVAGVMLLGMLGAAYALLSAARRSRDWGLRAACIVLGLVFILLGLGPVALASLALGLFGLPIALFILATGGTLMWSGFVAVPEWVARRMPALKSSPHARGTPLPEELRRELESPLAVAEAARERYAWLWANLSSLGWKDNLQLRLRQESEALSDMSRQESAVDAALESLQQRAKAQGWGEDAPVMQLVQGVRTHRERLRVLVHERLDSLVPTPGKPSLQEDLRWLGVALLERLPPEQRSGGMKP